jgi:hypothetical protein
MSSLVDLSHVVTDGMVTYPGLPAPVIRDHLSREASIGRYAPGTEFQIGRIEMVANTGTYVDARSTAMPADRSRGLIRGLGTPGLVVHAWALAIDHDGSPRSSCAAGRRPRAGIGRATRRMGWRTSVPGTGGA